MAEYFTARNLPVPAELSQNPLTRWRRLLVVGLSLAVVYIGLRITDIDVSHSNPDFAGRVIGICSNGIPASSLRRTNSKRGGTRPRA